MNEIYRIRTKYFWFTQMTDSNKTNREFHTLFSITNDNDVVTSKCSFSSYSLFDSIVRIKIEIFALY